MADLGAIGNSISMVKYVKGGEIKGIVYDHTNTPCARTLHLLERPLSTGSIAYLQATTSNAQTGAYTFPVKSSSLPGSNVEMLVLGMDDAAGDVYNDIIKRVIPA